MARRLKNIIAELQGKIELLASQRDDARRDCELLRCDVKKLQDQLEDSKESLNDARMEIDFLTLAERCDDPDNLISARRRVQRLIAKIDRCVALLKEDADFN